MTTVNKYLWKATKSKAIILVSGLGILSGCLPPATTNIEPINLSEHATATAFVHHSIFDIDGFDYNITEEPSEGLSIVDGLVDDYGLYEDWNLPSTIHAVPVTASEAGSYSLKLKWEVESETKEVEQQIEFAEVEHFAVDLQKWFPGSIETEAITYDSTGFVTLVMTDDAGSILLGRGKATLLDGDNESPITILDSYNYTYSGIQAQEIAIQLPNEHIVNTPSAEHIAEDETTSDWQLTVTGFSTEPAIEDGTVRNSLHFGLRLPDGRPFLHNHTDLEVVGPDHESNSFADDSASGLMTIDGIANDGTAGCVGNFRYDPQLGTEHQLEFCLGAACTELSLKGSIETTSDVSDCPW